jgi:hypothetical protein
MVHPVPLIASDGSAPIQVDGIGVNRYTLSMSPFLNATSQSSNDAYFAFGPNGVVNVSSCSFKADVSVRLVWPSVVALRGVSVRVTDFHVKAPFFRGRRRPVEQRDRCYTWKRQRARNLL